MTGAMEKNEVRRLMARRKKEYSASQFEQKSLQITARLQELPCWKKADTVFAYMDLPGEVKMREFILRCWEEGKTVAVPKIIASDTDDRITAAQMRFYRINSFEDLHEGMMHIMEPDPDRCECLDSEEDALIIMPGVAFDADRRRIGYGGGFYDRYLAEHPGHVTVAVGYEFQVLEQVPSQEQDIRPQLLVTEDRII